MQSTLTKRWKAIPYAVEIAKALQADLKIHPIFCRLLAQRGIETYEEAKQFFRPQLTDLHDPFLMKGMAEAVQRVVQAIQHKEKILLYGDYDVDGTTAVATLYSFLKPLHPHLDYYIPDRYKEGYGFSYQGIEYAANKGVGLIITLDCGIRATSQVAYCKQAGIEVIVCDHHLPGDRIPDAVAVLDPKQADCNYPYKELSGCGVGFKLAQGINQQLGRSFEHLTKLLDLVAISIASDIVEMRSENRVLTHFGLQQLNSTERIGLRMLIKNSGKQLPLSVSDVVFGLAPLINAAGRLADAEQAVKLLLAEHRVVAEDLTEVLELRNKMRREYDQRIAEEAMTLLEEDTYLQSRKSIVLYQPHWHKGVVGIAASRMVEAYHRPTIILTESSGKIVGSARSIKGFDIHEAIHSCGDLLINYGGHQHAAGLSLNPENLIVFQDRFEGYVSTMIAPEQLVPEISYTTKINFKDITSSFWNILRQFAPFGPGNRNPVFVTSQVQDTGYSRVLKEKHLSLSVRQAKSPVFYGIAFGQGERYEQIKPRKPFSICYTLEQNSWQGKSRLQLMVKDIKA